jgi:hypothetical protein
MVFPHMTYMKSVFLYIRMALKSGYFTCKQGQKEGQKQVPKGVKIAKIGLFGWYRMMYMIAFAYSYLGNVKNSEKRCFSSFWQISAFRHF